MKKKWRWLFVLNLFYWVAVPVIMAQQQPRITVTWDPPIDGATPVDGYRVYRGLMSGNTNIQLISMTTEEFIVDSSVLPATRYYYAISALKDGQESAKSLEATVMTSGGQGCNR